MTRSAARPATLALALVLVLADAGPARAGNFEEGVALLSRNRLEDARLLFRAAIEQNPDHYGALWRLSRVESELGEDARGEAQRQFVASAVEYGREAVRVAPDSAQGHLSLAIALGRQALREGPKTRLALSREVKSEADRAIAIDPTLGRAWHVRALWNRRIASLSTIERMAANTVLGGVPRGASLENAVSDLRRAVELEPEYVNHRLELGRTYLALKRRAEARAELEKAVSLPPRAPRDAHYQQEARALLEKLAP